MKRQISIVVSAVIFLIVSAFSLTVSAQDAASEPVTLTSKNTVVTFSDEVMKFDYSSKKPSLTVSYTDENGDVITLKNKTDYELVYSNNLNAGKGYVNINGINNYAGTIKKSFKIAKHSLSKDGKIKCTLSYDETTYSGKEKKPSVVINYSSNNGKKTTKLKKGKDYTIEYINNIDSGTATVKITGINNFSGTIKKKFKINRISISDKKKFDSTISYSKTTFSGKNKTPSVTLKYTADGKTVKLKKDADFTVTYTNNINPGKAKVKISGKGNFKGSITHEFIINTRTVTGVKVSDVKTDTAKISWKKQSNISGYEILIYDSKKKGYVHHSFIASDKDSVTVTKLNNAAVNKFKLRSYKIIDKKNVYGNYSKEIIVVTKPSKVSVTSVTKNDSKICVEWNSVSATGYEVFYTTDKNFKKNIKSVKINGGSKKSCTIKNINKSKTYYVKVRAFVKYKDKYYYGEKSSKLSTYYSNLYATYYSWYENNQNRTTNLKIASKAISGTIIPAGGTFSFNDVVGPRTTAKGYKSAHIFSGDAVVDGVGGGVCQVASTMFNCVLNANLSIVERHQHSQRVAYVPLGRDAAIFGTSQDFKWKNNTSHPMRIEMTVKDGKITCSLYTCEKVKPKKVSLNVTQNGNNFTLKRTVDGKVNYSCKSNY